MVEDLARRIKLDGPVLLRTISSRVELVVVCLKLPGVIIFFLMRNDPWTDGRVLPMFSSPECLETLLWCMLFIPFIFNYWLLTSDLFFFFLITHVQDNIDSKSEFDDDNRSQSAFSVVSNFDNIDTNTLGDISPDALWGTLRFLGTLQLFMTREVKLLCNSSVSYTINGLVPILV